MDVHGLIRVLPAAEELQERCRAFAVLDAVLEPMFPHHLFSPRWGDGVAGDGVALAQMDNGSGDLYAIAFDPAGAFLYGFDHECDATPWREEPREHWPGLLDGLPEVLARYAAEPAFQLHGFFDATVCAWNETRAGEWRCGPVVFDEGESDGSDWLFGLLVAGTADAYAAWAEDYFERPVDREAASSVLAGRPLTPAVVGALSPGADFAAVAAGAEAMGFPCRG